MRHWTYNTDGSIGPDRYTCDHCGTDGAPHSWHYLGMTCGGHERWFRDDVCLDCLISARGACSGVGLDESYDE